MEIGIKAAQTAALLAVAAIPGVATAQTTTAKELVDRLCSLGEKSDIYGFYAAEKEMRETQPDVFEILDGARAKAGIGDAETDGVARMYFYSNDLKKTAAYKTACAMTITVAQAPQKNTGNTGPNAGGNTAQTVTTMEPQAAYDQFLNTLGETVIDENNPAVKLTKAKAAAEELKATNPDVYKKLKENTATYYHLTTSADKLKAASMVDDYVVEMTKEATGAELDKLSGQVTVLQATVNVQHHEENLDIVAEICAQEADLRARAEATGKIADDLVKKDKNSRLKAVGAAILRKGVDAGANWALGQAESGARGPGREALGNIRQIYEGAIATREYGYAGNDVYADYAKLGTQPEKDAFIRDLRADKQGMLQEAGKVQQECKKFCKQYGITETERDSILQAEMKVAKNNYGITAVGPRVPQNPMSPETLDKIKGLSAEFQTALAAAEEKPDFDTVGNLIRSEKNFAATLKYAPKGGGPGRGA